MSERSGSVLIIEDQSSLRQQLGSVLEAAGFAVDYAADGRTGLQLALQSSPDLIVLDIGLPGINGLSLCRQLRDAEDKHTAVLMLTARDLLEDKLRGFDAGADDYLVKPFANAELVARCQALIQRQRVGRSHKVHVGTLCYDRRSKEFFRAGRALNLPRIPKEILLTLLEAWPRPVTRSHLIDVLWPDEVPASEPLRSHLYVLRQVLDAANERPMLLTVHGVGFRLDGEA